MSSIKCKKCGLVNFSTAFECKRCQQPLGNNKHFQPVNFQAPPPVEVYDSPSQNQFQYAAPCIKCGDKQDVSTQNFKKSYKPPIIILGIFLGLLPYFILRLLLTKTHHLTAPFCRRCWGKFKNVGVYSVLNALGFFVVLIVGIAVAVLFDSEVLFLLSFVAAILSYVFGYYYISSISPRYKKVNSQRVIIDAPLIGEVLYES